MAKPFVKCLGGKDKCAAEIAARFPTDQELSVYVEPFLGGGAVYFHLQREDRLAGKTCILGDYDSPLMDIYAAVQSDPHKLYKQTKQLVDELMTSRNPNKYYLGVRADWNKGTCTNPWHTLFLHRAAFNGLWRINAKGKNNAAIGLKNDGETPSCHLPPLPAFLECAEALEDAILLDWDFRQYEEQGLIGPGALVYLDPPYHAGFVSYVAEGFSEDDQCELIQLANTWSERGAHVVYSNANTSFIRHALELYWPTAVVEATAMPRRVNRDGEGRGDVTELLVSSALDE